MLNQTNQNKYSVVVSVVVDIVREKLHATKQTRMN